ncbi:hypothetical protein VHEMI08911 [[Torrubiella] hemipterigena]|uniref:Uncharacterized protein n=1 Tax=[Torrubiella] hemipterigena TaxID=1531966 RepID=A0A0A1TQK3_9HYPO|nr:hypothetical protein VHEMI08911 [[Torrubiella] hemipterigena]
MHDAYRKHAAAMEPILHHVLDPDKRQQLATLVEDYYDQNIATMTPRNLIVPYALPCLERTIARLQSTVDSERMVELGTIILTETVKPVTIDTTTTPESCMNLFAGNAIRLEYLGIIFAIACWASLTEIGHGKKQQEFISHLLRCSSACLHITRRLAPMNDMYMWLNHHHYILIATEQGHSCEETWSCLGDVLADITKFGMYKNSYTTLNTPFFLT